jgi:hypothetical protein
VPIWQPPVKTEAVEGATELAEVPGEKTKQLKEKPAVNLRRKSSNLRGDHDLIGEHDPAGIPNSKLEQVSTLYTFFSSSLTIWPKKLVMFASCKNIHSCQWQKYSW